MPSTTTIKNVQRFTSCSHFTLEELGGAITINMLHTEAVRSDISRIQTFHSMYLKSRTIKI